jgi:16S rRNA (uracil1498-N3)-methyltransferase
MKQFILKEPPDHKGFVRLSGRDYHYLVRVRRLRPGEGFNALLPDGGEVRVEVQSVANDCLLGVCLVPLPKDRGPSLPRIALFQALPKGGKMDLIVRQAAEGGLNEVVPFKAEYSAAKIKPGLPGDEKTGRWRRIVKEARQQSGSSVETEIKPPCGAEELLAYWETLKRRYSRLLGVLFHHAPLEQGSLHSYLSIIPEFVALAIGPEGGFSPGEVSRFLTAGFKPLVIGNTILRTETAALYCAAAVKIILLENASWMPKVPRP